MARSIRPTVAKRALVALFVFCSLFVLTPPPAHAAQSASLGSKSPINSNQGGGETAVPLTHRMRYNTLGAHNDIKLTAYFTSNSPATRQLRLISPEVGTNNCDYRLDTNTANPDTSIVQVIIEDGSGTKTYNIKAKNLCSQTTAYNDVNSQNNVLYASYPLEIPATKNPESKRHQVNITVQYTNIGYLNPNIDNDRNAISIDFNLPSGGILGPQAYNGQRDYSIIAKRNTDSTSVFRLPFAACKLGSTTNITVYDVDAGAMFGTPTLEVYKYGTETRMDLQNLENAPLDGSAKRVRLTSTNKERSVVRVTMAPEEQYVLVLRGLHSGNTVDIGLPANSSAFAGQFGCGIICVPGVDPACTNPPPSVKTVQLQAQATADASAEAEPTENVTFDGHVSASGLPELEERQWGYYEDAIRNAVNLVSDGNTAAEPIADTYRPAESHRVNSASSGNLQRECTRADGYRDYRQNCATDFTHYVCANGATRLIATGCGNSVGYYKWRCALNGDAWGYNTGQTSSNGCGAVYDYRCWGDNNVVATQHNQPGELCTRWRCNLPSDNSWNSMSNPPNRFACKIFRCAAVSSNITLPRYGGNGVFSNNNLNLSDPADPNYVSNSGGQQILANAGCGYRCTGTNGALDLNGTPGGGEAPRLGGAEYGNDKHCYRPAKFDLVCSWRNAAGVVIAQSVTSVTTEDGNRDNYCPSSVVQQGQFAGQELCVSYEASSSPGWYGPNNNPRGYYAVPGNALNQTWVIDFGPRAGACVTIIAKPITEVLGGDISAGAGIPNGAFCTSRASSIEAWPGKSFNGSRTNLASFASGNIFGFVSAYNNPTGAPNGLAFASDWNGLNERFGGSYSATHCITDYYGNMPPSTQNQGSMTAVMASPNKTGSYLINSSTTIGPTSIPAGGPDAKQVSVYINGDLTITGDITYANRNSWGSAAENIPALRVIVRGNIYIQNGVRNLDGIYIAQPNGATGGEIFTCGNDPFNSNPFVNCNNTLTVRGTFTAKRVHMGRSVGTAIQGTISERFIYLPELWQADWPDDNTTLQVDFDSVISLPPVL